MDKLPEPDFKSDPNWPRLLLGVDSAKSANEQKYLKTFTALSLLTSFRYLREVTYYKKNLAQTAVVLPLLLLSSHFLAQYNSFCPYVLAAEKNNQREREYIQKYKSLLRQLDSKVPDDLIL